MVEPLCETHRHGASGDGFHQRAGPLGKGGARLRYTASVEIVCENTGDGRVTWIDVNRWCERDSERVGAPVGLVMSLKSQQIGQDDNAHGFAQANRSR